MPTLTLRFKNNQIASYSIEKGQSLVIGRGPDNDIVIENLAVSGHHAKIDSLGDDFVITDLKSKNGIFVNEQITNSHWLKDGDVINIGKHSLCFSHSADKIESDEQMDRMEETMVMDTSKYRSMIRKSAPNYPKPMSRKKNHIGVLAWLSGGKGKYKLKNKIINIGRDKTCDIIVKGFLLGRTAATISKRPDGYHLSYVSGLAKPKVNDRVVKQSTVLNDLDIIDIGKAKLQFFLKTKSNEPTAG